MGNRHFDGLFIINILTNFKDCSEKLAASSRNIPYESVHEYQYKIRLNVDKIFELDFDSMYAFEECFYLKRKQHYMVSFVIFNLIGIVGKQFDL